MNKRITTFVEDLASVSLPNVFNPYADFCPDFDMQDAKTIRKQNLLKAINSAIRQEATSLWIAQDLGYRGGRRTGLALTDEAHLVEHGQMLGQHPFLKATRGPVVAERTAEVVWRALRSINQPVLLWNVFPLHPHLPAQPMSNRCHTRAEREIGLGFLKELLDLLEPKLVIAIGSQASAALRHLGVECFLARHPSYGGQSDFFRAISASYDCKILAKRASDETSLFES